MDDTPQPLPSTWLKELAPEMAALDTVPLLCAPKDFSWDDFASRLQGKLGLNSVRIETTIPSFQKMEQEQEPSFLVGAHVGVINSPIFFSLPKEEVLVLFYHLLGEEIKHEEKVEESYIQGFKDFLIGVAIDLVEKLSPEEDWSIRSFDVQEPYQGQALTYTVQIHIDEMFSIDILVCLPTEFDRDWRAIKREERHHTPLEKKIEASIEMELGLQIGKVSLSFQDWKGLEQGDFLVLDQLLWPPLKEKGRAFLIFRGKPIYLASIKKEGMKLLEHVKHYQEREPMTQEEDDLLSEEDLIEEEEPLEEESLAEETTEEEDTEEASDDDNEEGEVEETSLEEEAEEEEIPAVEEGVSPIEPFDKEQVSVQLSIEVGRLKITLDHLTKMQPGNVLKLNVAPENGVDLVVNGRVIGRGELLSIGDLLGVRVLDLG